MANTKVIRFKKNDEIISELKKYCQKNNIFSAWFSGLGAAYSTDLAVYNIETKKYLRKSFSGKLEIINYVGNISKLGGEIIVHSHGTFCDDDFQAFAGHVDKIIVSGTAEILLTTLNQNLTRAKNEETGLNLLDIENN